MSTRLEPLIKAVSRAPAGLRAADGSQRDTLVFGGLLLCLYLGVYLLGLLRGEPPRVFHYTDEALYHWPLIEAFAAGGLRAGFDAYSSATTPLFHLSFAALRVGLGQGLWELRALNALLGAATGWLVFVWLARQSADRLGPWLLGASFALAPYVFGRSFWLLTETSALFLLVLAFLSFDLWERGGRARHLWAAALWVGLAVMVRQHLLWISLYFGVCTLLAPALGARERLAHSAVWLLPALAFVPFLFLWQGAVPPAFGETNQAASLDARGILFTFAAYGLYTGLLAPSRLIQFARCRPAIVAVLTAFTFALCASAGLRFQVLEFDGGYLWRLSQYTPTLLGANLLLAGLAAGGVVDLARSLGEGRWRLPLFVLLFALSFVSVARHFQNYWEAQLLLVVLWDFSASDRPVSRLDLSGRILWIAFSVFYFAACAIALAG